jgi:hypothetical protein
MMSYSFSNSTSAIVAIVAIVKSLKSDVRFSRITDTSQNGITSKCCHIKNSTTVKTVSLKTCTTVLLVSLLATCQPSYAITKSYPIQISDNNVSLDKVAASGNHGYQELRNLFKHVQHHTIVDVFLCLPFISLPVMGELRLAIALIALWWGGRGNKPFTRRILCAVCLTVSNLPTALYLGQIIKKSLPFEKVQTK